MVRKRITSVGKIKPYIDVRNTKDIPQFESLISTGPITIVLVYADWCGHCKHLKDEMWDELAKSPNKGVPTAAVHYDMVDKTSMKKTPIEGYPTIFELKATPQANISTPIPTPRSKEEMKKILNFNANNVSNSEENPKQIANMEENVPEVANVENVPRDRLQSRSLNTYVPVSLPPNISKDTVEDNAISTVVKSQTQKGGSLFESLLKIAADSAHAVVLAGSAAEIAQRMKKRKTKKAKYSAKKKTKKGTRKY